MDAASNLHPKVVDIILENFRQALRAAETAFSIALSFGFILVAWGFQGDFDRDVRNQLAAHKAAAADSAASAETRKELERIEVEVPVLKFKANLDTAAFFGLLAYIIFAFRSGNHIRKSALIANRIGAIDSQLLDAILTTPSIATAGRHTQIAFALVLGGLGVIASYFYMVPVAATIGNSPWRNTIFVLLPALYFGWQLLAWRRLATKQENAVYPSIERTD